MASRKEEKERLRQAREAAEASERSSQQKRLWLGYTVAGVIILAVVVGLVIAVAGGGGDGDSEQAADGERLNRTFGILPDGVEVDSREATEAPGEGTPDLAAAAKAAGCELLTDQRDEGATHIDPDSKLPDYGANPPTSGDHSPDPLADGAFVTTPSPLNYIHALEHGRIEIQYRTELPEADQLQLLALYDEDSPGMMLFPNDDQPYLVAATAWRQTLGCDTYEGEATLDAIRAFRDQYRGRGPEPVAMQ
jgi:hypothetical protein